MESAAFLQIESTPLAVRDGLRTLFCKPVMTSLPVDMRGNAELVLAEALNNIVEHAYAEYHGPIEMCVNRSSGRLYFEVVDQGIPMPNGALPPGLAQQIDIDQDLPEGGFGWFLIRLLTENLTYRRVDARNHLSFQLNIEQ
jgi:serine/threonine-protein kinase RsbW